MVLWKRGTEVGYGGARAVLRRGMVCARGTKTGYVVQGVHGRRHDVPHGTDILPRYTPTPSIILFPKPSTILTPYA